MIESPLVMKTLFTVGPVPVTEPVVVTWGLMAVADAGRPVRSRARLRSPRRVTKPCSSSSSGPSRIKSKARCVLRRSLMCR